VRDLFVIPAVDPAEEGGYEISGAAFAMKPRSRGTVRLNGSDPRTPLAIDHGFLRDPHDAEVLVEGFEALRALGTSEPVRRYAAREIRPGPEVPARDHVLAEARGLFHPVGTCAIGSVVDSKGRVHCYENLVVADASVMPSVPAANTNLSTAAVAERIAELL
jgi:choline dehydrogenase-like flavoprotein